MGGRKKIDLTGRTFGRLKVLKEIEERNPNGSINWICLCECGNETIVRSGNLISGKTRSCGCYNLEALTENKTIKIEDGTVFGKLKVNKRIGSKTYNSGYKRALYLCECECGNSAEVDGTSLRRGDTTSCGCNRNQSLMQTPEAMEKKSISRHKTDFVERTSLSGISPTRKKSKGKTSKNIGVYLEKRSGRWFSKLQLKGVDVHYKSHKTEEEAIKARKEAEKTYFKPVLEKHGKE